MVGGVCAGLSSYFNIATWIPRLIFLSPILLGFLNQFFWGPVGLLAIPFGGMLFLAYIILWIVVPMASSASEKLEMRGEKVDLESIRETVREEIQGIKTRSAKLGEQVEKKAEAWGREASQTASHVASTMANSGRRSGIGRAIGMLFKIFFLFIASLLAFTLVMALVGLLFGTVVLFPLKDFILRDFWENATAGGTIILFLAVPIIALVIWLIRRITGTRSKNNYLGYAFGTLWALGWVSLFAFISLMVRHFEKRAETEEVVPINQPTTGSLELRLGRYPGRFERISWFEDENDGPALSPENDSLILNTVNIRIARSPDSLYRINIVKAARETTGSEAEKIAEKITFILQQKDSIIYLPKGFAIAATDKFRNQQVILVVEVPVGKNIRIDGANEWFDFFDIKGRRNGLHLNFSYNYDDQFYPFKYDRWYKMRSDGLSKLGQSPEERIEELKDQLEDEFREFRRDDRTSRDSIKVKIDGKDTLIDIKVGLSKRMGV